MKEWLSKLHIRHFVHHFSTYLFMFGFVFDAFTLPDVNNPTTKYLGIFYMAVLSICILLREYVISRNKATSFEQKIYNFLTFLILITSGALLSFVFIYYTRSAELSVSWPLLLAIIGVMISNEFISTHSFRFLLDIVILLIGNIFFFIFNIPLLIDKQNDTIFAVSVFVATLVALLYINILKYTSDMAKETAASAQAIAVALPIAIFLLYTTNIMPAVPLSLSEADVFHSIIKSGDGTFLVKDEIRSKWNIKEIIGHKTYHYSSGQPLYFFSSIHAPAKLEAPISHVWEYYDDKNKEWVESLKISFPITGGREAGYRGYSKKESLSSGKWRVTVKAGERRIVGRMVFYVEKVAEPIKTIDQKI